MITRTAMITSMADHNSLPDQKTTHNTVHHLEHHNSPRSEIFIVHDTEHSHDTNNTDNHHHPHHHVTERARTLLKMIHTLWIKVSFTYYVGLCVCLLLGIIIGAVGMWTKTSMTDTRYAHTHCTQPLETMPIHVLRINWETHLAGPNPQVHYHPKYGCYVMVIVNDQTPFIQYPTLTTTP